MSEDALSGMLYPRLPALVTRTADGHAVELVNFAEGWSCTATGTMAKAIIDSLRRERRGPILDALGDEHPVARTTARLSEQAGLGLTPAAAVALDGFDTLFIELVGSCNERCIHCYATADADVAPRLDRATCEAVLEDAAAMGVRRVQLTGGEPLMCPFVPQLVEHAATVGIASCEIFTNGLLLAPPLLERLAPLRPAFAFSVYSSTPEIHDAITRTPGSHRRTMQAIERALRAGLRVRAAVIVMQQNAHTVEHTVKTLESLGVDPVGASAMHAVGRGDHYRGPVRVSGAVAVAASTGPAGSSDRHCDEGDESAHRGGRLCVTYDGCVVPCIFNREDVLGRIGQRRLREIAAAPDVAPADAEDHVDGNRLLGGFRQRLQCRSCQLTAFALRRWSVGRRNR